MLVPDRRRRRLRRQLTEVCTRPVQHDFHVPNCRADHLDCLRNREAEHIAEDENRALEERQLGGAGHQRLLNRRLGPEMLRADGALEASPVLNRPLAMSEVEADEGRATLERHSKERPLEKSDVPRCRLERGGSQRFLDEIFAIEHGATHSCTEAVQRRPRRCN